MSSLRQAQFPRTEYSQITLLTQKHVPYHDINLMHMILKISARLTTGEFFYRLRQWMNACCYQKAKSDIRRIKPGTNLHQSPSQEVLRLDLLAPCIFRALGLWCSGSCENTSLKHVLSCEFTRWFCQKLRMCSKLARSSAA